MKIVFILIILQGTKCMSLQFADLRPQHYHVPIVNIKGVNQSILYYKGNNNDMLINFILKDVYTNQPVLLVSGDSITINGLTNKNPNIILLMENLNIDDFETKAFKTLLFSYWSVLLLVITSRSEFYACENGTLSNNAYAETKNYLNELWQVFRVTRVTVSFPYTCPKHYVIYGDKEWSGTDVYNRSIRLIRPNNKKEYVSALEYSGDSHELAKDYPLRVSIFYRFPTSITECDIVSKYTYEDFKENRFCGLDGVIMHDYIKHYKFKVSMVADEKCDDYGYVDRINNGTILGSLGCIVKEQIDISFNSRFLWHYTSERYFYLNYVFQESLCAILKRSQQIPLWHYAGNTFTPLIWAAILSCVSFLGTLNWLAVKLIAKFTDERPLKLYSYLFNAIHTTLFGVLLKNDGKFLILKGSCLLCSIIILAVNQGHVNYQFTTRSYYSQIKTLEQLYASPCVLFTSPSIIDLLKPNKVVPNNADQAAFLKRAYIRNDTTTLEYIIENPYITTLARQKDVMAVVLQNHTDLNGLPRIYVMEECFQTFYLSFIARYGFLFIEESLKFMMRLTEAGLPNKYYMWATRGTVKLHDKWPDMGPKPRPIRQISLENLRIAFGLLLLGYVVSGIVFFVERWKGRKPGIKSGVTSLDK